MQPTTATSEELDSDARLIFRPLLSIDIEKYSARSALEQLRAQMNLRRALDHATEFAGLEAELLHQQLGGDGELLVLPEGTDVARVVGGFTQGLEIGLAGINAENSSLMRLRVRLALHYGTLVIGRDAPFGPAGDAPIVVSRLLNSRPLRQHLTQRQDLDVALIVSDSLFRDVVRTGFCALRPSDFQRVRIAAKKNTYHGYIYFPEPIDSQDSIMPD